MFKALNHLMPEQISKRFLPLTLQHSHQTRSLTKGNLYIPSSQLLVQQRTLNYFGSKLWNNIPVEVRNAPSLSTFKEQLKKFLFDRDNHS